jgi:hypothetical protein
VDLSNLLSILTSSVTHRFRYMYLFFDCPLIELATVLLLRRAIDVGTHCQGVVPVRLLWGAVALEEWQYLCFGKGDKRFVA